jgi:hypothetical protein
MSDYRNPDFDPLNPEDPYRRDAKMDPDVRAANVVWGWVAAGVLVVALLAVIFGIARQPGSIGTNTASNDTITQSAPPAATHMAPPTGMPQTPAPKPITPAPNGMAPAAPAQPSGDSQ